MPLGHRKGGNGRRRRRPVRAAGSAPDQIPGSRRARRAQAAAGRRQRPQDRPEPEVRLAGACAARHRHRALRRHHADVLCARRRQRSATARRARASATSTTQPSTSTTSTGTGKAQVTFDASPIEKAARICRRGRRHDAAAVAGAEAAHGRRARDDASTRRWSARCRAVLARMERRGISIDRQVLSRLSGEFAQQQARAGTRDQRDLPASRLNPGSPKQLGDILFGKMGLPGGTKTKTGQWSTGARVLEELAEQGHRTAAARFSTGGRCRSCARPIPTRCRTTSIRTTKRVHTILRARRDLDRPPVVVRAEPAEHPDPHRGRPQDPPRLRRGARQQAGLGRLFADRIAAARRSRRRAGAAARRFKDGVDIHAMTASEMFGVPVKDMPGDIRRRAKAINFGIIYGISAFGLANQLCDRARGGRRLYQEIFRALPRHPRLHGRDQGVLPRRTAMCSRCSAASATIPDIKASNRLDPRLQRARRDQCAPARLGRRHHPPRHDPHGRRAGGRQAHRRRCCCRCTTN